MNFEVLTSSDSPDKSVNSKDDEDGEVLPGFRFHPTDEELVGFYLRRKIEKKPLSIALIKQVDIYKYDPWDLPKLSMVGDKEWYFFCIRGRKYRNSIRPNRVTGSGFWKATGIDKPIYSSNNQYDCIGLKKSLAYYQGTAGKGTKTDWMMHEFRLPPLSPSTTSTNNESTNDSLACDAEVWTICRILRRVPSQRKYTPTTKDGDSLVFSGKGINSADSSSKSSSHDSGCTEQYMSFRDSSVHQQNQTKNRVTTTLVVDEWSDAWMNPLTSTFAFQEPFTMAAYNSHPAASFWNNNAYGEQDLFKYGIWDELQSVVDRALDP